MLPKPHHLVDGDPAEPVGLSTRVRGLLSTHAPRRHVDTGSLFWALDSGVGMHTCEEM